MALSDPISISSMALALVGERGISSFEEDSDAAETCARLYPLAKAMLLSRGDWKFAKRKRQLNRSTTDPLNEWAYAYDLPSDRVQGTGARAVFNSADPDALPTTDFEHFGGQIFAEDTELYIDYTFDASEAEFPAYFLDLIVHDLAARIGEPVTGKTTKAEAMHLKAYGSPSENGEGGLMAVAKKADSKLNPPRSPLENGGPLIQARLG